MPYTNPKPISERNNPYWPLPADYFSLDAEGKRQARVNSSRMHTLYETTSQESRADRMYKAEMKARSYIGGLRIFDHYYLRRAKNDEGEVVHDPGFYDRDPLPNPAYFDEISTAYCLHKRTVFCGPRGGSKTSFNKKATLFDLVPQLLHSTAYITATNDLSERVGDDLRHQCFHNRRIRDDFDKEYEGGLVPIRGERRMAMSSFVLNNGSQLFTNSTESRKRGGRPKVVRLDDPEWDESQSTNMEMLREWFKRLIFVVLAPMLFQQGSKFIWTGTFVSQQHMLWQAMLTQDVVQPDGSIRKMAMDKRFDKWYRILTPAGRYETKEDGTTELVSSWPEMWPANAEEREQLNLSPDVETLPEIEESMGSPAFQAEMMCNPGAGLGAYWPVTTEKDHGYWFEDMDRHILDAPYLSNTNVCWFDSKGTIKRRRLRELLFTCGSFITLDTAYTETPDSDFKVAQCMSVIEDGTLFSWEIEAANLEDNEWLIDKAFDMAWRWQSGRIAPELITNGHDLERKLQARQGQQGATDLSRHVFYGSIACLGVNTRGATKCAKITSLRWRILGGKVKIYWKAAMQPGTIMAALKAQIDGFRNKGGDETGLHKDDLLDTLALSTYVISSNPPRNTESEAPKTDMEAIASGELTDERGQNRALKLVLGGVHPSVLAGLIDREPIIHAKPLPFV